LAASDSHIRRTPLGHSAGTGLFYACVASLVLATSASCNRCTAKPRALVTGRPSGFATSIALMDDVDGDGLRDLAISSPVEGRIEFVSSHSGMTMGLVSYSGDKAFGLALLVLDDIDGRGAGDVLVAGSQAIYVFSSETKNLLYVHPRPNSSARVAVTAVIDLDFDGLRDIAVLDGASKCLSVLSSGKGALIWRVPLARSPVATAVVWDSRSSQIVFASHEATVNALERCGVGGKLEEPLRIDSPGVVGESLLVIDDLDGDERPDYIINCRTSSADIHGSVVAVSGRTGAQLRRFQAYRDLSDFGRAVVCLRDAAVGGDSSCLAVGSPRLWQSKHRSQGAVTVISPAIENIICVVAAPVGAFGFGRAIVADRNRVYVAAPDTEGESHGTAGVYVLAF